MKIRIFDYFEQLTKKHQIIYVLDFVDRGAKILKFAGSRQLPIAHVQRLRRPCQSGPFT